jgi:hypothetical protein
MGPGIVVLRPAPVKDFRARGILMCHVIVIDR